MMIIALLQIIGYLKKILKKINVIMLRIQIIPAVQMHHILQLEELLKFVSPRLYSTQ